MNFALILGLALSRPFVFDGCTLFPEGTAENPKLWSECCLEHDLRFWAGGSRRLRDEADRQLRRCVKERGDAAVGDMMYLGVILGSLSPVKFPGKRWGNAWEKPRYEKLTADQISLIEAALGQYDVPKEIEARLIESLSE